MKIKKKEFQTSTMQTAFPEVHIEKVISEFVPMITARKLKFYFYRKNTFKFLIKADWKKYQLIVFNII